MQKHHKVYTATEADIPSVCPHCNATYNFYYYGEDEDSLVANPVVVSVSLGESCDFILRGKGSNSEVVTVPLKDGDVLVMGAGTQKFYTHSITKKVHKTMRISLTFRQFR